MDLLLKMQNLRILVNEKWYISTLVWSRGMIFSQCLENNKFYEMSEGIFDILISYQIMGVQTKKICSEKENFRFSTIKNPSANLKKNPKTLHRFCQNISKSALTHCGREDLRKWTIFNTILTSPKSWLSQEDLDARFEHSLMPMDC